MKRGSTQYKACCDRYYANYRDWQQGRTDRPLEFDNDLLYAAVVELVWMRDNQSGIEDNMEDGGSTRALVIMDSMAKLADKKQQKLFHSWVVPFTIILQAADAMLYAAEVVPGNEFAEEVLSQLKGIGVQIPGIL